MCDYLHEKKKIYTFEYFFGKKKNELLKSLPPLDTADPHLCISACFLNK